MCFGFAAHQSRRGRCIRALISCPVCGFGRTRGEASWLRQAGRDERLISLCFRRSEPARTPLSAYPPSLTAQAGPRYPCLTACAGPRPPYLAAQAGPRYPCLTACAGPRPPYLAAQAGPRPPYLAVQAGPRPLGLTVHAGPRPPCLTARAGPRPPYLAVQAGPRPPCLAARAGPGPPCLAAYTGPRSLLASQRRWALDLPASQRTRAPDLPAAPETNPSPRLLREAPVLLGAGSCPGGSEISLRPGSFGEVKPPSKGSCACSVSIRRYGCIMRSEIVLSSRRASPFPSIFSFHECTAVKYIRLPLLERRERSKNKKQKRIKLVQGKRII